MNMAVDATSRWRVHPTKRFVRVGDFCGCVVWVGVFSFQIGLQVELSLFVEDGQALEAELKNEFSVKKIGVILSMLLLNRKLKGRTIRHTLGGRHPAAVDTYVIYPIIYKVLWYIPGSCLGFLPSTVCNIYFPTAASPGSRTGLHGDLPTIQAVWWC